MARKRQFEEISHEANPPQAQKPSLLETIRSKWEFACITEFIFLFGDALKLDKDLDVEVLEEDCLKPGSPKLAELGLGLLKSVSSHRGLTAELFDEYTRRQYVARAPHRNPFGVAEEPAKFTEFDVLLKLRVLHQLSLWTLNNPDRVREKMEESDKDQTEWRMEPLGWDSEDRVIYVFDDDRLYRWTDAPLPPPPPANKSKSKSKARKSTGSRANKRRKAFSGNAVEEDEEEDDTSALEVAAEAQLPVDDGLDGAKWECIAVTLAEYHSYLESIKRSRHADEKALHKRITDEIIPIIEKKAEAQERKALKRQRELENLEKLAFAKRSSRIAGRAERQKEVEAAEEAERKRKHDLEMAHKELERQRKLEEARESRMMTREQRIRDREMKRILHEDELARLEADSQNNDSGNEGRVSERRRKAELEKRQKVLEDIKQEEEEDWYFDCSVCGVHGHNLDDGTHIVACEKCNVWQHSSCHGIAEADAERDDFHFLCASCTRPPKPAPSKDKTSPESAKKKTTPQKPKGEKRGRGRPPKNKSMDTSSQTPKAQTASKASSKLTNGHSSLSHVNGIADDDLLTKYDDDFDVPPQHGRLLSWQIEAGASSYDANGSRNRSDQEFDEGGASASPVQQRQDPSALQFSHYTPSSHNPYLNNFSRQHQSLNTSNSKKARRTPILSPTLPQGATFDGSSRPASAAGIEASTPKHQRTIAGDHISPGSSHAMKSFAQSPTPSLSATQGNTDVRFSPSRPNGSPGNSSYAVTTAAGEARDGSPVRSPKQHSTPWHQASSRTEYGNVLRASSSSAARSPTKQSPTTGTPGVSFNSTVTNGGSPSFAADTVMQAPILSPSPGADRRVMEPPTKKDMPPASTFVSFEGASGGIGGDESLGLGVEYAMNGSGRFDGVDDDDDNNRTEEKHAESGIVEVKMGGTD